MSTAVLLFFAHIPMQMNASVKECETYTTIIGVLQQFACVYFLAVLFHSIREQGLCA